MFWQLMPIMDSFVLLRLDNIISRSFSQFSGPADRPDFAAMTLVGESVYNLALNQLNMNEDQVPSFVPPVCSFVREFSRCIGIFR